MEREREREREREIREIREKRRKRDREREGGEREGGVHIHVCIDIVEVQTDNIICISKNIWRKRGRKGREKKKVKLISTYSLA